MSSKPEGTFTRSVHGHLVDTYAMKNNNPYLAGIPDCWYSGHTADLWVEYKFITTKKPGLIIPDLSRQQLYWIESRRAEGRDIWVIVGMKAGGVIIKGLRNMKQGITLYTILSRKEIASEISLHCNK